VLAVIFVLLLVQGMGEFLFSQRDFDQFFFLAPYGLFPQFSLKILRCSLLSSSLDS
jgi:hypothetical protein